ncbi:helix-turn-helix transcriptional regulator [Sorangium sp. So ce375]|uniref:AraC family transcriptional regulator n=1 Tax=Sorangium sp. So ce375 TaxID=3133306 RepID=UPI003F5CB85D
MPSPRNLPLLAGSPAPGPSRSEPRAPVDVDAVDLPAFALADDVQPFRGDVHAHRKHQLLYAGAGVLHLEVGSAHWILPPHRAAFIAAHAMHRAHAAGPVALRTVYLSPRLTRAPLPSGDAQGEERVDCRVFAVTPLAREMILHAMRWGPDHGGRDETATLFFKTLGALCREWVAEPLPFKLPVARSPELDRAMRFAREHLGERPTLDDAARAARTSTRTLSRRFVEEARTTWTEYLSTARMLRAMDLLVVSGARVTDVAIAVGFDSLGAFTRAFAAFTGERPKDYRARAQANQAPEE